jgi:hypothetical protein
MKMFEPFTSFFQKKDRIREPIWYTLSTAPGHGRPFLNPLQAALSDQRAQIMIVFHCVLMPEKVALRAGLGCSCAAAVADQRIGFGATS